VFHVGDIVIHPNYGAGTVIDIDKLACLGTSTDKRYYEIELLNEPETLVWVPVSDAEEVLGVRRPSSFSMIQQIWEVLSREPESLPSDYKKRNEMIREKFGTDDLVQIAEALRDLAWRREKKHKLTQSGKRLYRKGMKRLASEIAVIKGQAISLAQAQISKKLYASFAKMSA